MAKIHTHYDNLRVTRNAPVEVIRAAYKSLSQRFHPDKNPGSAEANRIMAIINASYEVLSDPDRRRAHDEWIERQENANARASTHDPDRRRQEPQAKPPVETPTRTSSSGVARHFNSYWALYLIAIFVLWVWISDTSKSVPSVASPSSPRPYQVDATPIAQAYTRPVTAPNGAPWPASAGYVKGYKKLHVDGLSAVTIDNSRNDSDVFVKLVFLGQSTAYPVRQFFVPRYGRFTVTRVRSGEYDVRYRDLESGGLSRSEPFRLEETAVDGGRRYRNITMTLYKVEGGNMQTYGLAESEF